MLRTFTLALLLASTTLTARAQQVLGGNNLLGAPPAQSIGNEANWYIDFITGNVWGPKTSGQWPFSSNLVTTTTGTLAVASGGTGATTATAALTSLGAAASGANSDITSLNGLTTPLSVGQGGTNNTSGDLSLLTITPTGGSPKALSNYANALPGATASVNGSGIPGWTGPTYIYQPITNDYSKVGETLNSTLNLKNATVYGNVATYNAIYGNTQTNTYDQGYQWVVAGRLDTTTLRATGAQNLAMQATAFANTPTPINITSITGDGVHVTFNFAATPTTWQSGDHVIISGAPAGLNGTFTLTNSVAGSATIANTTAGPFTTSGTIVDTELGYVYPMQLNFVDNTGISDPLSPKGGLEIGLHFNNTNGSSTDANNRRIGVHIGLNGTAGGTGDVIGRAGYIDMVNATANYGWQMDGTYNVATFDTTNATTKVAFMMANTQKIVFDGNSSGVYNTSLYSTGGKLAFLTPNGLAFTVDYNGLFSGNYGNFGATQYATLIAKYPCNLANQGVFAFITDSTVSTFHATVAGGGSNKGYVSCNAVNYVFGL